VTTQRLLNTQATYRPAAAGDERPADRPTVRAVLIGAIGALAIGLGAPWATYVLHGSAMGFDHTTPEAVLLLFLLAAGPRTLLWRLRPRLRLSSAEMITVFSMMLLASAVSTKGVTDPLVGMAPGSFYYVTEENGWRSLILDSFPRWLAPVGADSRAPVIRYFYEGLPPSRGVPWMSWLPMLAAYAPFVIAYYAATVSLMVLLRRQWTDNERLTYSMTQLPLELAGAESGGFPRLLHSKVFWIGFAVPAGLGILKGLHFYEIVAKGSHVGVEVYGLGFC